MKTCEQYRQWIWLNVYEELFDEQKNLLFEHIKNCPECRLEYDEAKRTVSLLNRKLQLEPTGSQLKTSRAELHHRLVLLTQPRYHQNWGARLWKIISLDFTPGFRLATATALFIIGIIVGNLFFNTGDSEFEFDHKSTSELNPANISNIESVQYNPITRQVSIKLSTINDMTIEGGVEEPAIQDLLAQTLLNDNRPNIKLKTVNALQNTSNMNEKLINSLRKVIDKEENPGIRLKAVKLLTSIPIKEVLSQVLVSVFLNDSNSAIRIQAFKKLSSFENETAAPVIINAAKNDSSEYIRTKAKQFLERTENPGILK